jgi:hypothetical protein
MYFSKKFKEPTRVNIEEIESISSYFPIFIDEDQNSSLMATIKRGEMKKLVDSFQKDKKLGLDG